MTCWRRTMKIFLYRFSDRPDLVQGWTTDRQRLRSAHGRVPARADGDVRRVAEAVHLAATGQHQKKALVLLSDGNGHLQHDEPSSTAAAHSRK
jgi:hypothetical protein